MGKVRFERIPLWEFAKKVRREIEIRPNEKYRTLGCRLYGQGVYQRETKLGAEIRASKMFLVRENDFVINRIWAQKGSAGIVPKEVSGSVATQDFPTFALDNSKVLPDFIAWYVKTQDFWEECRRHSHGTSGRQRLSPKEIANVTFPICELQEQESIVTKIKSCMKRIDEIRKLRFEAMKESEILFEQTVDSAFKTVADVKKEKLANLTNKIGSGSTPIGGRSSYPSSGIPFIRSMNVRMRKFQWDGIVFISRTTHDVMNGTQVKPYDVLLNITGASLGRVACVPAGILEANVNQHVSIIRPTEALNPRFLMYWLSQPSVQILMNEKQKGETREGLTKAQIEEFEMPIPPLEEQHRIVTYLESLQEKVDQLQILQNETGKDVDGLVTSILNTAFAGEL